MSNIRKIFLLMFLLAGLLVPVHYACAVIPFEVTLPESGGKFATWVQEKLSLVQTKISGITESKIAKGIGDGIKKIKEVRDCVQEQYSGKSETSSKCKPYVDKYPFLANALKLAGNRNELIGKIKDTKAYEIVQLSRSISDDAIKLNNLRENQQKEIEKKKDETNVNIQAIDAKIEMAKEDLKVLASSYGTVFAEGDEESYDNMSDDMVQLKDYIKQLEMDKINAADQLAEDIIRIGKQFTQEIETVTVRQSMNIEKVTGLKVALKQKEEKTGNGETATPAEIVSQAQNKYSADINTPDTMEDAGKRLKQINEDVAVTNVAGINKSNNYIAELNNQDNNASVDVQLGGTAEGESEAVQPSIDNTMKQIDLVQKIISMELEELEAKTMEVIMQNTNYKMQHRESGNNSLLVDVCKYKLASPSTQSSDTTPEASDSSAGKPSSVSEGEEYYDDVFEDGTEEIGLGNDGAATGRTLGTESAVIGKTTGQTRSLNAEKSITGNTTNQSGSSSTKKNTTTKKSSKTKVEEIIM